MAVDVWLSVGFGAATFLLLIAPVLVYGWYVLEGMIGDDASYERVVAAVSPSRREP
jgi:hypothetical protein